MELVEGVVSQKPCACKLVRLGVKGMGYILLVMSGEAMGAFNRRVLASVFFKVTAMGFVGVALVMESMQNFASRED